MLLHFDMEDAASEPHIERQDKLHASLSDELQPKPFFKILHELFHRPRRWPIYMLVHPLDIEPITKTFPVYIHLL